MKIRTAMLTGAALDWATARAADLPYPYVYSEAGEQVSVSPSTDWSQGGPIIDQADITVGPWDTSPAMAQPKGWPGTGPRMVGPTKLIAAMRCFVAYRLGDEVDVPDEVCQ